MRLLPLSPKGTWLLAAAAWAAVCTAVWMMLPVNPWATLHLPVDSDLIGLGPGTETALVDRQVRLPNEDYVDHHELELFDVPYGRRLGSLVDRCGEIRLVGRSGDGQIWLIHDSGRPGARLMRFDWANRSLRILAARAYDHSWHRCAMSRDGQLCVLDGTTNKSLVLWDTRNDRQIAELPGLKPPCAFSEDGLSLLAAVADQVPEEIDVVDLGVLVTQRRLTPVGTKLEYAYLTTLGSNGRIGMSTNGSFVCAQYQGIEGLFWKTQCWEFTTGKPCRGEQTQPWLGGFLVGNNTLVTEVESRANADSQLQWIDLKNGFTTSVAPTASHTGWEPSPDGRTIGAWEDENSHEPMVKLARRLGLSWLFGSCDMRARYRLYKASNGKHVGDIPAFRELAFHSLVGMNAWAFPPMRWGADGRTMAVGHNKSLEGPQRLAEWQLWDIPPRKPLLWLAIAAAIFALPLAGLAWIRSRRLRREVA